MSDAADLVAARTAFERCYGIMVAHTDEWQLSQNRILGLQKQLEAEAEAANSIAKDAEAARINVFSTWEAYQRIRKGFGQ